MMSWAFVCGLHGNLLQHAIVYLHVYSFERTAELTLGHWKFNVSKFAIINSCKIQKLPLSFASDFPTPSGNSRDEALTCNMKRNEFKQNCPYIYDVILRSVIKLDQMWVRQDSKEQTPTSTTLFQSKIEKVPRGIQGEMSSKVMASSGNLVSIRPQCIILSVHFSMVTKTLWTTRSGKGCGVCSMMRRWSSLWNYCTFGSVVLVAATLYQFCRTLLSCDRSVSVHRPAGMYVMGVDCVSLFFSASTVGYQRRVVTKSISRSRFCQ